MRNGRQVEAALRRKGHAYGLTRSEMHSAPKRHGTCASEQMLSASTRKGAWRLVSPLAALVAPRRITAAGDTCRTRITRRSTPRLLFDAFWYLTQNIWDALCGWGHVWGVLDLRAVQRLRGTRVARLHGSSSLVRYNARRPMARSRRALSANGLLPRAGRVPTGRLCHSQPSA